MIPCFYTLAAGGGDGLFFFILVVITVVVQIFRLARKSRPASGQGTPGGNVFGRGDELGSFLETLARSGEPAAETPAPPPVPTPVRVQPAPTHTTPAPPMRPSRRQAQLRSTAQKSPKQAIESRQKLMKSLRGTQSIRQAVLLREILGPPTGLAGPPGRGRQ